MAVGALPYDEPVTSSGYLRYPTIRGDLVAFVADDDLWLVPAAGGQARRITADRVPASGPRISPDGSLVAWTSLRDGLPEVYLAGTGGGTASRVTYWSEAYTRLLGWSPDGELLAITSSGQPFARRTWAHAIPVTGGAGRFSGARRLPYGPVADVAMSGGAVALLAGRGQVEPAFWKRYRGGRAGRLWVAVAGAAFRRVLADVPGQFDSPQLVGGRLAFLSDHEGTGNVYSCALDGTGLRRHTDHDGFYARNASSDGTRIVYQCAGEIWLLDGLSQDSEPVRLEISLGAPVMGRVPGLVTAVDQLDDLACDHTGQASAVTVRGTVHWLTHRDGPARALSAIPGPAARLPRVLGTTGQVTWVVEADGADALEIAPADGTGADGDGERRRVAAGQIGWAADLAAAPDGTVIAVAARDGGLHLVDVGSGEVTELARSQAGPMAGLAFAPDSGWLAWSQPEREGLARIRLARLAGRQVTDVTDGRFFDSDPAFTADGLYLAFLSRRTFDPVHDAHVFDLAFPYGSKPYLVTLAAGTPSPFGPLPAGRPAGAPKDDDKPERKGAQGDGGEEDGSTAAAGGDSDGDGDGGPEPVAVDLEGLAARVVQVPVPESRYSSLRAVDGGLAWLREPLAGNLGVGAARPDDDRPRSALEHFDIKRGRCTELLGEVTWFEVSGDGTRIVAYDRGQVSVVPANRSADQDSAEDKVSVDLSRARFLADPVALWRAAYEQAGRIMRHEFWVADMADVDWDGVLGQYRPLLGAIATADDFADLIHDMVGELGSSHAYVRGAGRERRTGELAGLLGADLEATQDGWRIARVLPGESSDPWARSPLAAPGTPAGAGDLVLAVDGQPVDANAGPGPLLVGSAGKPVELTLRRPGDAAPRRAVVVPLADDGRLRYQDWVAGRRRIVRDLGGGRLGYLHVPDMDSEGWADFHRDLRREMLCDGLVVDVRGNRGGNTSQLVIEKLARRIVGWDLPRHALPSSYPFDAPRGPVVAVADEWSASDGDIVTAAIRLLEIGPVVGTRTWGGVIGIDDWHELVDGTAITVPRYSFWFDQLGWGVENYGVDPDVEVLISPDDWAADADPQLETAVRLALGALERRPPLTAPGTESRPSLRRPPLPPRGGGK